MISATQRKTASSLFAVANHVDLVLVVGSETSANSKHLVEVAVLSGVQAYLIEDENDINATSLETVYRIALTAGASSPELLVERVSHRLQEFGFTNMEDIGIVSEAIHFRLPIELACLGATQPRLTTVRLVSFSELDCLNRVCLRSETQRRTRRVSLATI